MSRCTESHSGPCFLILVTHPDRCSGLACSEPGSLLGFLQVILGVNVIRQIDGVLSQDRKRLGNPAKLEQDVSHLRAQVTRQKRNATLAPERVLAWKDLLLDPIGRFKNVVDLSHFVEALDTCANREDVVLLS